MPEAIRSAAVTWTGTLTQGNGRVTVPSGVLTDSPVTWASRVEAPRAAPAPRS